MREHITTFRLRAFGATCLMLILAAAFSPATVSGEEPPARGARLLGGLAADFDTDQDGVISREEFDRGAETLFDELDQDADGALSSDELPRFRGPRHGHGPGKGPGRGPMAGMIVARAADGDRDGEVTNAEWQGFLDSLEVGADGAIVEESLRALLPRPPGMRQAPDGERGPRSGHLTRLLDRDGDSVLETEDLNAVFNELDQDGDGALQGEELPRFRGHRGRPGTASPR